MHVTFSSLLAYAALVAAGPTLSPRAVDKLDEAATAEAQQRDNTATRAFSNVQIKTSDGKCLFVDKLSGDFRANLTPIQVAECGSTDGQGWDVITQGKHIDVTGAMLVVSTLTNACFNFDPRRKAGNQVLLFSCGGRAAGVIMSILMPFGVFSEGQATTSQIFAFDGGAGPLSFKPANQVGSCFTVKGNVLDIAKCDTADAKQTFTFGGAAAGGGAGNGNGNAASSSAAQTDSVAAPTTTTTAQSGNGGNNGKGTGKGTQTTPAAETSTTAGASNGNAGNAGQETTSTPCTRRTRTVFVTQKPTGVVLNPAQPGGDETPAPTGKATAIPNPTTPVPVSRAGGTLDPSAAAQAQQRDDTADRAFSSVEIRAPNGQCLFVDPTAGDFRQNLIPVSLVDCSGTDNEKWDVITKGKHNDGTAKGALIVSSLMNGCISLDGRRAAGDTVTMFSCGGRADGEGGTNSGQVMPFGGETSFAFALVAENGKTCILNGPDGRLTSGPCPTDGSQLFSIFP